MFKSVLADYFRCRNKVPYDMYIIEFDTNQLPLNFNQYIELDILKEKKRKLDFNEKFKINKNFEDCGITLGEYLFLCACEEIKIKNKNGSDYMGLDKLLSVVIESYDEDFELELGGAHYKIQKGRKYISSFAGLHEFYIKLTPGLKIYVYPDLEHFNDLWYLTSTEQVIYKNFIVIGETNSSSMNIVKFGGMYGTLKDVENTLLNYKQIDENIFYNDFENSLREEYVNKLEDFVKTIDDYIQYGFFKFYKKNSLN